MTAGWGHPFIFCPRKMCGALDLLFPAIQSLLVGSDSRPEGNQVRIKWRCQTPALPAQVVLLNSRWALPKSSLVGSEQGLREQRRVEAPRRPAGIPQPAGIPCSPSRSTCPMVRGPLLSRNASEHPEIVAWLFVFLFFGRVISLYPPFYFLFPAKSRHRTFISVSSR